MRKMSDLTYMIIAAAVILYGILSFLVGTKVNQFRTVNTMDNTVDEVIISQKSIAKPKFLYKADLSIKEIPCDLTNTPKEKIYL